MNAEDTTFQQSRSQQFKPLSDLTIMDDFMFGMVMRDETLCKPLIERVLNMEISDIHYLNVQEMLHPEFNAHGIRMDVYVEDLSGTGYDIEVQVSDRKDIAPRTRYYHSLIDLKLLRKGQTRYTALHKSYVIFICPFDPFGADQYVYTFEKMCREVPRLPLQDGATTVIVNTAGTKGVIHPALEKLIYYLRTNQATDDYTRQIEQAIEDVKNRKETEVAYVSLYERLMDEREVGRQEGRREGRQEGRQEGQQREHMNMLRKMYLYFLEVLGQSQATQVLKSRFDATDEEIAAIQAEAVSG